MYIAKNNRGEYLNTYEIEGRTLYKWDDIPKIFRGEGDIDFQISQRGWLLINNTTYEIFPVDIP